MAETTAPRRSTEKAIPFDDDVAWRPWSPSEVAAHLAPVRTASGTSVRWAVAAGWAIDLMLGRVTREHEDVEVVVLNDDVDAVLAAFQPPRWRWRVPIRGWLYPLDSPAFSQSHQTWLWGDVNQAFVLDMFRDTHEGDTWICRREEATRRPWQEVVRTTPEGIPFLAPEIVLLFKAKAARAKDVADLHAALPQLDGDSRSWLRSAISRIHPGHGWLDEIEA